LAVALLSLTVANAERASDNTSWSYWATEFAKTIRDQTATPGQHEWPDLSALGYAKTTRSDAAAVRWLPQPLPAVDGINGKIAGFGGGADHTSGFYAATGSLSLPLAQQWGVQIDGAIGSLVNSGFSRGAGHLFWRDPSVGLVGAYGSYSHWNGIGALNIPRIGVNIGRYAAEGEYYWSRWNFHALAGYETVRLSVPNVAGLAGLLSIPDRFFDWVSASYYVTDNFKLAIGHRYCIGRHELTLGSEHGFALGGGSMASLFAAARLAEHGDNVVLAGLRFYLGQRDKTLIDRHRQDDPEDDSMSMPPGRSQQLAAETFHKSGGGTCSDIRLKRDIVQVARLDNGIGLYRYRYIWSDDVYVGVMAQEVAEVIPDAVLRGADGYLRVNYARLGLHLMTWDEWIQQAARR
jgi:hypothetical protein